MLGRGALSLFSQRGSGASDPSAGYALYLNFKTQLYRSGSTLKSGAVRQNQANSSEVVTAFGGCTLTANATNSPISTLTADLVTEDGTTAQRYPASFPVSGGGGTLFAASIYVKRSSGTRCIQFYEPVTGAFITFDTTDSTYQMNGTGAISATIVADANGFYRATAVFRGAPTTAAVYYGMVPTKASAALASYAGDSASGLYLWGLQIELGSASTAYIATSGTAVSAGGIADLTGYTYTRTGAKEELNGSTGTLGAEVAPNTTFDTSTSVTLGNGAAIAGGVLDLGTNGAGFGQESCPATTAGQRYRMTVTVLSLGTGAPQLQVGSAAGGLAEYITQTLIAGANTVEFSIPISRAELLFRLTNTTNGTTTTIDTVTVKTVTYDNIDDFAANVPGIVSGIGYWSRSGVTNLLLQSQDFATTWTLGSDTITTNTQVAPDGFTTADTITPIAGTTGHQVFQSMGTASAAVYTNSVFAKMGTARWLGMAFNSTAAADGAYFDLQSGVVGTVAGGTTAYIQSVGNGWYRCTITRTLSAITQYHLLEPHTADAQVFTWNAAGTETLYVWQAQSMLGNFPDGGPIIPTAGTTVAVGADVLATTITAPTDVDQVFFAKMNQPGAVSGIASIMQLDDGTANNRVLLYTNGGTDFRAFVAVGGALQHDSGFVGTPGTDTIFVLRRLGGNWRGGYIVGGTLTWSAAAAAGTFPAGMVNNRPGSYVGTGNQPNARIANQGIKVGTFTTDAEVIAAASIA